MTGDETFLSRWSRRKQAARVGRAEADEPESPESKAPAPAQAPAESETETKASLDLPPIESLGKDSDYAPYLREGVPENLRRQALSRLWASDPAFAAPDPLDLYNLDFRAPAAAEAVATLFRVGRGMVDPEEPTPAAEPNTETATVASKPAEPQAGLVASETACSEAQNNASVPGKDDIERANKKSG